MGAHGWVGARGWRWGLALAALAALVLAAPWRLNALGDERFGVIMGGEMSEANVRHVLDSLGLRWWFEFGTSQVDPAGYYRVELLRTDPKLPVIDAGTLAARARARPGKYWMIGNEPNVPGQDGTPPADYAEIFYYYYTTIKAADPSAKIVAPNALNSVDTCGGCVGFTQGNQWVDDFRQAYRTTYGSEPPIDVWALHSYNIDWVRLPMTDYQWSQRQVAEFRRYVDAIPGQAGKPIWVTEFGVIWGFDCYELVGDQVRACGTYRTDKMMEYLRQMGQWFQANGPAYNIQKWFIYISYGQPEPYADQFAGIALMDGPRPGAGLTAFGQLYRDLAAPAPTPTPTATPTPSPTPAPPPPPPSGGGGGGGGGAPPPSLPEPTRTPPPTPTPAGTPTPTPVAKVIASGGGTLQSPDGKVVIEVPGAAITEPVTFRYMPQAVPPPEGRRRALLAFSLAAEASGAAVTQFDPPLWIRVSYTGADILGIDEASLQLYYQGAAGEWVALPTEVDAANNTARAKVAHLTRFALRGQELYKLYLPIAVKNRVSQ